MHLGLFRTALQFRKPVLQGDVPLQRHLDGCKETRRQTPSKLKRPRKEDELSAQGRGRKLGRVLDCKQWAMYRGWGEENVRRVEERKNTKRRRNRGIHCSQPAFPDKGNIKVPKVESILM